MQDFDLVAVDGTAPLFQRVARLEHGYLPLRPALHQLIGGKNTAGAGADDDNIISHGDTSLMFYPQNIITRKRKLATRNFLWQAYQNVISLFLS